MVANTKNTKFAVSFTCIGFLFCLTSLFAPYWLQNDGKLQNPKFSNIGECSHYFTGCGRFDHVPNPSRTLARLLQ